MKQENENIDIILKERFEDFSPDVPESIWENIEKDFKSSRSFIIGKWHIAASLLAGMAIAMTMWLRSDNQSNQISDNNEKIIFNKQVNKKKDIIASVASKENEITENDNTIFTGDAGKSNRPIPVNNNEPNSKNNEIISGNENNERISIKADESPKIEWLSGISIHEIFFQTKKQDLRKSEHNSTIIADNIIEDGNNEDKVSRIAIGGHFSPLLSYRNNSGTHLGSSEVPLISFITGLNIEYKINDRFYVSSGVNYQQIGNDQKDLWYRKSYIYSLSGNKDDQTIYNHGWGNSEQEIVYLVFDNSIGTIEFDDDQYLQIDDVKMSESTDIGTGVDPNPASQIIVAQSLNEEQVSVRSDMYEKLDASLIQKISIIEIPLSLRFKIINKKKIGVNIISGINTNFIIKNKVYLTNNFDFYGTTNNINTINISGTLGVGLEYPVFSNISLTFEPTFKYFLNNINQSDKKIYPYTFGVYSGIKYSF